MKAISALFLLAILSTSCREKWNEEDKQAFYQACTEEAKKSWAPTDQIAKTYCDCVFDKMYKKYPHEEDALEHIDILAKDTDLIKCKEEIMKK